MRESTIEDHLVSRVQALGGECRKVRWLGRNAAPDRFVMLPIDMDKNPSAADYLRCVFWVELKAPGKKPRLSQVREHERMRRMGQRVVVIDSIESVEELLA